MFRYHMLSRTVLKLLLAVSTLGVWLAPLAAQDRAATVIAQTGMVSIMDGGYARALSVGGSVRPQQLIITGADGYARFQVSDGTTFEVFQNSRVIFRETLGDWRHLVNVILGRIKVFVQHAPGVPNPNNVTSPTAVISVRGTVFDVVVEDADGTTFVTVDEGQVAVRNMTAPGNPAVLNPGDSIRVIRGQALLGKQMDRGNVIRRALQATRDILVQIAVGNPGGTGAGVPGTTTTTGGAQGDKGKDGGTTTGTPPAPTGTPTPPGGN
jgi:ferric-dicitrate binding protein FerR (iron transport regulator)